MLDKESIKKEVYKNEKNKLTTKFVIFNVIAFFLIMISLSSKYINPDETKIIEEYKKRTNMIYQENDSLKKFVLTQLNDNNIIKEELIKKSLSLSMDTSYDSISPLSVSDMYDIAKKQSQDYNNLNEKANIKMDSIINIPNITPISSSDMINITSYFGYRKHPIYKRWIFHEGIDIAANKRMNVFATADGIVENVYREKNGYGNRVVIKHKYGYKTVYAHLNSIVVKKGQKIKKNDKIGYVGNTGTSTDNHLHYEILVKNRPVDPLNYIHAYNKNN